MKKIVSVFLTLAMIASFLTVPQKVDAAVPTIVANGANQIELKAKEIVAPTLKITEGGMFNISVSVPDKGDIWIKVVDSKKNVIMSDSGNWVENPVNKLFDLNISALVFPGDYTIALENSDKEAVKYTLNTSFTPATLLANGKATAFNIDGQNNVLYRLNATAKGFFNIKLPSCPANDPYSIDCYLYDAYGNKIDDDDANPDWDMKAGKMNWNTINLQKGIYYLQINNGSKNFFSSSVTATYKIPSTKVKLNKTKVTLKKKKTFKIKAKLTPSNSTDTFKYKSSNKKVVTVSKTGKVKAKKKGKAVITVTATSGKKAKLKVTVK